MSSEPLICDNLCFHYPCGRVMLQSASLTVHTDDRIGLVGDNGCGKTTFLRILAGLLKIQTGTIDFYGEPLKTEADFVTARRTLGFVLQNPDDQLFFPQVIDDVAFGLLNLGYSQEQARNRSGAILETLGISHLASRLSYELSGGQKKMVSLATVLVMNPRFILLDEPTNGLDHEAKNRIIDRIAQLAIPTLIVSHDDEVLARTTNRRVTIRHHQFEELSV